MKEQFHLIHDSHLRAIVKRTHTERGFRKCLSSGIKVKLIRRNEYVHIIQLEIYFLFSSSLALEDNQKRCLGLIAIKYNR